MDRDDITLCIDILHIQHMLHITAQIPCSVYRYIGIEAIHLHAEMLCHIGNLYADGAKSDDTQLLSLDLRTGKILLCLLCRLGNILVVLVLFYPLDTADNVAGCEKHTGDHKLLDAVCIGSRRIKYNNSLLSTFVKRNIVHACTRSRDREKLIRQLHIVHGGASHKNTVRFVDIVCLNILSAEFLKAYSGDWI